MSGYRICSICHKHYYEDFMIQDNLWDYVINKYQIDKSENVCMLCISKALKRKLRSDDFSDYPINYWIKAIDFTE